MDKIRLSEEERAKLEQLLRRGKAKARMIKRAHIVLKSAAGWGLEQIAETVGVSEARVSNVRRR